jgi:hypothetical protein
MKKEHVLGLIGFCLVIVVLSISGLASDIITRLGLDLDGLLLILVSLLMAGLFSLMLLLIAKDHGWIPTRNKTESAAAKPTAKAAAPSAPARPAPAKAQAAETAEPVSVRPGEGK